MRENLQFRAWYKDWNSFVYLSKIDFLNKQYGIAGPDDFEEFLVPFDSCELQRFTGLKLNDGTELFEGDIVEYQPVPYDTSTGIIIFSKYNNGWAIKDCKEYPVGVYGECGLDSVYLSLTDIRIVSNIFETPKLIEMT